MPNFMPAAALDPHSLALLALLVAGHLVGDCVLQTEGLSVAKRRPSGLAAHVALLILAQLLAVVPYVTVPVVGVVLGIGAAHGLIDAVKTRLAGARRPHLLVSLADQVAHGATVVVGWAAVVGWTGVRPVLDVEPQRTTAAGLLVAAYAFNWGGAAVIVKAVLERFRIPGPDDEAPDDAGEEDRFGGTGRAIGILERLIVLTLVLVDAWGALGLILAAKSIARFKKLEERHFSEYYLIGTLASVFIAMVSGLLVKLVLGAL